MSEKYTYVTDDALRVYIPHVYQDSIHDIDYDQLLKAGVKAISFDMDGTINSWLTLDSKPSKETMLLFQTLKQKFDQNVYILSNSRFDEKVKKAAENLGLDESNYIAGAKKPISNGFEEVLKRASERCGKKLDKKQMAHIGDHMEDDVAGGNTFGCITCLVNHLPFSTTKSLKRERLRAEMKERHLWTKDYFHMEGDQYYQYEEGKDNLQALGTYQKWK